MDRVAISIVLNAKHHLIDQARVIPQIVDKWIIVEGASQSTFCTSWCGSMPSEFHNNGYSVDGTTEFLTKLASNDKRVTYIPPVNGLWNAKVSMFNEALKHVTEKCYLWEIDIDEYWNEEKLFYSELILENLGADIGAFCCDYLLSDNVIVRGAWGEATTHGYHRLWKYTPGSLFTSHEPPRLQNTSKVVPQQLMPRFKHLSYYYNQDVLFKSKWYGNHQNIYDGWKSIIDGSTKLPCGIDKLFRAAVPQDWQNTIITYQ